MTIIVLSEDITVEIGDDRGAIIVDGVRYEYVK